MIPAIITAVTSIISTVVDRAVPDAKQAAELKNKLTTELLKLNQAELQASAGIIMAEAQGESWLQRNWRPIMMVIFACLIVLHWVGMTPPNLSDATIENLMSIVEVGLGGYIIGRSGEKIARTLKQ